MSRDATRRRPPSVQALARDLEPEIAGLPRLSLVVERFLANAGRDTARAGDFADALELDPVLSGWVLRQANSGFCNLSRPVASVAQACVVIGVAPLSRLVYAACTRDLLRRPLVCYRHPGQGFWLHGLAVCAAAGRLAELAGDRVGLGPEEARVAGLIHDVGKLLLDGRLPRADGPRSVSLAEERALIGADHGLVSAAVATQWSLPTAVVDAVAGHHDPTPPPGARCLALADRLVRHWGLGIWTYARLDLEPPWRDLVEQAEPLGVDRALLVAWCESLPPVLAGLEEMVRAIGHGEPPALPPSTTAPVPEPSGRTSRRPRRPSARRKSPRRRR
jgi:putative nucleotidyltransferase with HDIG domain